MLIIDILLLRADTKDLVKPKKVFVTSRNTASYENAKPYFDVRESGKLELKLGSVSSINESSVVFGDGSEEQIDTIIYATGYKFTFPFFNPEDKIIEFDEGGHSGKYFGPLYKKMFSINETGIVFIGLLGRLVHIMATLERQVMLAKQLVLGQLPLPSKELMLESLQSELDKNAEIGHLRDKFYLFSVDPRGYSSIHYHNDMIEMTNLPIDKDNYSAVLTKIIPVYQNLVKEGNGSKFNMSDFSSILEGVDFKPTSDTF